MPIVQQHRNKLFHQSMFTLGIISEKVNANILSLGCGGSRDLLAWRAQLRETGANVTLVDVDVKALELSESRLARKIHEPGGGVGTGAG